LEMRSLVPAGRGAAHVAVACVVALAALAEAGRVVVPSGEGTEVPAVAVEAAAVAADGSCNLLVLASQLSQIEGRLDRHSREYWAVQLVGVAFGGIRSFGQHLARVLSGGSRISPKWLKVRGRDAEKITASLASSWDTWRRYADEDQRLRPVYDCSSRLANVWRDLRVKDRWSTLTTTAIPAVLEYCAAEMSWALLEIDPDMQKLYGRKLGSLRTLPKQTCFLPLAPGVDAPQQGLVEAFDVSPERKRKREPDRQPMDTTRHDADIDLGGTDGRPLLSDMSMTSATGTGPVNSDMSMASAPYDEAPRVDEASRGEERRGGRRWGPPEIFRTSFSDVSFDSGLAAVAAGVPRMKTGGSPSGPWFDSELHPPEEIVTSRASGTPAKDSPRETRRNNR